MDKKSPAAGKAAKSKRKSNQAFFGSDLVASALREQEIPYVCLNPGASFRGLHDSIVNFLGNRTPEMALCLHEEHAVAVAHGYARVAEKPLAVIVHSNVGLMHASMAIFNAWCDRLPVVILGATGPWDAALRRPYIDWIHTAADQGALVRDYTKWDDQPGSPEAAVESIRRGAMIAMTPPRGPVYINLDAAIQEQELSDWPELDDVARFAAPPAPAVPADVLDRAVGILGKARSPLILCGRVSRDADDWDRRVDLAERLGARVITSTWCSGGFPTDHPLHAATAGFFPGPSLEAHQQADAVLSLDWNDLGGTLKAVWRNNTKPTIINASMDFHLHRGWSKDYQALPPVDVSLPTTPDMAVAALLDALPKKVRKGPPKADKPALATVPAKGPIGIREFAAVWRKVSDGYDTCIVNLPIGWPAAAITHNHPLEFMGNTGGGGLGAGPAVIVGAAMALRDRGAKRIPVAILGDGDYLMGVQALWTAAHMKVPMLVIVDNNRSYFNDEMHQENVAHRRGRPPENRWIGQRIDDPPPDLAGLARAQGLEAAGPVDDIADLGPAIKKGLERAKAGKCYVLEVLALGEYVTSPIHDRKTG